MLINKRRCLLIFLDALVFTIIYFVCAAMMAVAAKIPNTNGINFGSLPRFLGNYAVFLLLIMAMRFVFRIYHNVWRYANTRVYLEIILSDALGGLIAMILTHLLPDLLDLGLWRSAVVVSLFNIATLASRMIYQQYHKTANLPNRHKRNTNVAIVGAGQIGTLLAEDLENNPNSTFRPVCFIDTNHEKIGGLLLGHRVIAPDDALVTTLHGLGVEEIIIALPKMNAEGKKRIFNYYIRLGFKVIIYDFQFLEDEENPPEK